MPRADSFDITLTAAVPGSQDYLGVNEDTAADGAALAVVGGDLDRAFPLTRKPGAGNTWSHQERGRL